MKKLAFLSFLAAISLSFLISSCEKDERETIQRARPVYTEWKDVDNDGQLDLVIGFEKMDLDRLEQQNVVLQGYFPSTDTRFETDPFFVGR